RPGAAGTGTTRRTENVSYQSSRLVRRVRIPQGGIKRMSISVLLAHSVRWEGTGAKAKRVVEPPSAEKIKVMHDLVAGLTGFRTERGDQLIVESLPFESSLVTEPPGVAVSAPVVAPPPAAI